MYTQTWRNYFYGLGFYAVCLVPATLPIFQPSLDLGAAARLGLAAALASVLVALLRLTGFDERIGDPGAKFTQALLGIAICAGLYAWLAQVSQPQIMLMSLLWIALSLAQINPWQALTLTVLYLGIYLNAFSGSLLDARDPRHADAIYTILMSLTLGAFMFKRTLHYRKARDVQAEMHDENMRQQAELKEATARIHAITRQDLDTIALKFPFFKEELRRVKERADATGVAFSVGLIEIDHFTALQEKHGETVIKQVLREVVERIGGVMGKLNLEEAEDGSYHPLGKVGEGLYGMILPRSNLKGALACARQVHSAVELQSIRTMSGALDVNLTIGVVEYYSGESVDELMEMVGRSLEKARIHHMEELQAAQKPKQQAPVVKAATSATELRVLHYKEYDSPLH